MEPFSIFFTKTCCTRVFDWGTNLGFPPLMELNSLGKWKFPKISNWFFLVLDFTGILIWAVDLCLDNLKIYVNIRENRGKRRINCAFCSWFSFVFEFSRRGLFIMSDGYYSSKKTDDICEDIYGHVLLFFNVLGFWLEEIWCWSLVFILLYWVLVVFGFSEIF